MDALAQLKSALEGRYTVEREIGAGGMATVYLARDARHNRNVALKVLNPELGAVLGVERFLAEIQVTANLQHPNLLPLFDSGEAQGLLFYVMPYVEGESLRKRLEREKQLPIDEAVHITVAVASALDYAHGHGVIHRDLKPENILLQAGQPVIADFGIALAVSNAGGARITQTGISLGTPQYMSPEQATGDRAIDGRTDVYSLAAMLHEMLTGDPPHVASTSQAIIAKVLTERPPSVRTARPSVPKHVAQTLERALEKLPADRFATAHEFSDALQGRALANSATLSAEGPSAVAPVAARSRLARVLARVLGSPATTVGALVVAAGAATAWWVAAHRQERPATVHFGLTPGPAERVWTSTAFPGSTVAISPDGTLIVYVGAGTGGNPQLFARPLDDTQARPLSGTEGAQQPFFSPDGRSIGFVAGQQLKKIAVAGGTAVPLAEVPGGMNGASWGPNDVIVISTRGKLAVVPAGGGAIRPLGGRDSTSQYWPSVLPGGKHVVYTLWRGTTTSAKLAIASIADGSTRALDVAGFFPLGVLDGQLIYGSTGGSLMAVPFDAGRLRATGPPTLAVDRVVVGGSGATKAALSRSGSLVYVRGSSTRQLVLVDPTGPTRTLLAEPRAYNSPRFSPDGRRVAVDVATGTSTDVWSFDIASGTLMRLTTEGTVNERPEWAPDGKRVLFRSDRAGQRTSLWWQPADGSGRAELLLAQPDRDLWEGVLAPDGRTLVYRTGTTGTADVWYRGLGGDTTSKPVAATPATEFAARLSPDGRWVAYVSDESGARQIYVRPFPGPGGVVQASVDGGESPIWSRDGRRLFYHRGQQFLSATITTTNPPAVTAREMLFEGDFVLATGHASYDVSPDGKQFLLVKPTGGESQVIVVHDWKSELRRRTTAQSPR